MIKINIGDLVLTESGRVALVLDFEGEVELEIMLVYFPLSTRRSMRTGPWIVGQIEIEDGFKVLSSVRSTNEQVKRQDKL